MKSKLTRYRKVWLTLRGYTYLREQKEKQPYAKIVGITENLMMEIVVAIMSWGECKIIWTFVMAIRKYIVNILNEEKK